MILTNEAFYAVLKSDRRRATQCGHEHALPRLHIHQMTKGYNWCIGVLLQDLGGPSAHVRQVLVVESRFPRFFPDAPGSMPALGPHPAPGLSFEDHVPGSAAAVGYTAAIMLVTPFEPGCAPEHVQARLRRFCEERHIDRSATGITRRVADCHARYSAARIQVAVGKHPF